MANDDTTKDTTGADTTGAADTTAADTTSTDDTTGADNGAGAGDNKGTVETPEARKARLERQLDQHKKKHPELYTTDTTTTSTTSKPADLDYGQKAFLVANGIKGDAETKLVQTYMKETGKTLEQVLESKLFQAELKETRELATTSDAIPTGSRSTTAATDSVEYWLTRDFKDVPADMRSKVVDARMKKDGNKGQFYNSK